MTNKLGSLIIDVASKTLTPVEREMLMHPLVGGVVLFARNYESREQLQALCRSIRAARKDPMLIMVDQEGGRVQRFITEFTRLPPIAAFGKLYDHHPESALELAENAGWLMATELLAMNIDLSLAPVLDLNNPVSRVIGNRAFHANPKVVIELARAYIKGMNEAGMAETGKHFPGHGSIEPDSHVANPLDNRSLEEIAKGDLFPFAELIKTNIKALMVAHIVYPRVDNIAVGFSRIWLHDILRKQLNFRGVIMTDDLNMEGANISSNYADRVTAALEAGCDFALLCNNHKGVVSALDSVKQTYQVNIEKWGVLQGQFARANKSTSDNARWQKTNKQLLELTI